MLLFRGTVYAIMRKPTNPEWYKTHVRRLKSAFDKDAIGDAALIPREKPAAPQSRLARHFKVPIIAKDKNLTVLGNSLNLSRF